MNQPRMNLFRAVVRKERARVRKVDGRKLSPQLIASAVLVAGTLLFNLKANREHKAKLEAMRAEVAELDNQVKEAVSVAEAGARSAGGGRKPAAAPKPSGMDGSWTAVLWKFAAFTGQTVVIRDIQLAPLQNGGRIQAVNIHGQATSYVEMRDWLQRLIENMPGSEFSLQTQKLGDDPDFPVSFTLQAQVI